jgi:HupE / UreJ protein
MSSTILRPNRAARLVATLVVVLATIPAASAGAHEIPSRVTVLAFVKPEPGRLRIVLRAPLEAMRDTHFPERALGYLDLARAEPLARDAAQLWIANFIEAYEGGNRLPDAHIVATRISLPSDKSFGSYDAAMSHVFGPPLPVSTDLPWQQAVLDVVLDYPASSVNGNFALRPQLGRLGIKTTTVLRFLAPSGAERAYEYVGDPGLVRLDPRWYHAASQFVKLGIQHILSGIDHLLFVLCLVIPFRRLRPLVLIVTSFTVAHSITLVSAAIGVAPDALWFPPLIETLIAASIVYMALENIVGPKLQRRWLIAFAFGLVHGFAFSFALRESLQFAGSHVATSLFTFNLGVEIGQLLVLAVAVPVISLAFKYAVAERMGIIVLSALVAHTAWHWMLDRGAALREYQFVWPTFDLAFAASAMRAMIVLLIIAAAAWGLSEAFRRLLRQPGISETEAL